MPNADSWKTAGKQLEKVPSGSQIARRENSRKDLEKNSQNNQPKQLFFGFGLFFGCLTGTLPGTQRHLFRLVSGCFQCHTFGTSPDGHFKIKNPFIKITMACHRKNVNS